MKRYPWVKYLKRSKPELPYDSPIYLGNWSNGEFFHEQTPHERKLHARDPARGRRQGAQARHGSPRVHGERDGHVTALSVLQQACSSSDGGKGGTGGRASTPPRGQRRCKRQSPAATGVTRQRRRHRGRRGQAVQGGAAGMGRARAAARPAAAGAAARAAPAWTTRTTCASRASTASTRTRASTRRCAKTRRAKVLRLRRSSSTVRPTASTTRPNAMWRTAPPPGFNDSLRRSAVRQVPRRPGQLRRPGRLRAADVPRERHDDDRALGVAVRPGPERSQQQSVPRRHARLDQQGPRGFAARGQPRQRRAVGRRRRHGHGGQHVRRRRLEGVSGRARHAVLHG